MREREIRGGELAGDKRRRRREGEPEFVGKGRAKSWNRREDRLQRHILTLITKISQFEVYDNKGTSENDL